MKKHLWNPAQLPSSLTTSDEKVYSVCYLCISRSLWSSTFLDFSIFCSICQVSCWPLSSWASMPTWTPGNAIDSCFLHRLVHTTRPRLFSSLSHENSAQKVEKRSFNRNKNTSRFSKHVIFCQNAVSNRVQSWKESVAHRTTISTTVAASPQRAYTKHNHTRAGTQQ